MFDKATYFLHIIHWNFYLTISFLDITFQLVIKLQYKKVYIYTNLQGGDSC